MNCVNPICRRIRIGLVIMIAWLGGCLGMVKPAPEANADRVANTGEALATSAKKNCPGESAAIAAAESAAAAARAASDAVQAASGKRDQARNKLPSLRTAASAASAEERRLSQALKAQQDAYAAADAEYKAADDHYDNVVAQSIMLKIDTSDANVDGAIGRMKAGLEVPANLAALARAKMRKDALHAKHRENKAKYEPRIDELTGYYNEARKISLAKEKELETAKTAEEAADAAFTAALKDLNDKTKAARAANAALAKACPKAQNEVYPASSRAPGAQPAGLDVFHGTTSQHQEPPGHH